MIPNAITNEFRRYVELNCFGLLKFDDGANVLRGHGRKGWVLLGEPQTIDEAWIAAAKHIGRRAAEEMKQEWGRRC